jgi:hypothetical protein
VEADTVRLVDSNFMKPSVRCSSWSAFLGTSSQVLTTQKVSSIVLSVEYVNANSPNAALYTSVSSSQIACSTQSSASSIVSGLIAAYGGSSAMSESFGCDNNTWTIATCGSGSPSICVNCNSTSRLAATTQIKTCGTDCQSDKGYLNPDYYVRTLKIAFASKTPAPGISSVVGTATSNSIITTVTLAYDGYVQCSALTAQPSNIHSILQASQASWSSEQVAVMEFNGLSPSTRYAVYCATTSYDGVQMSYTSSVNAAVSVSTMCCKSLVQTLQLKSIIQGQYQTSAVLLTLSSLPTSFVVATVVAKLVTQFDSSASCDSSIAFSPSTINITSCSTNLVTNGIPFNLLASGCYGTYEVSISLMGSSASQFSMVKTGTSSFDIISSATQPSAPQISTGRFSSDATTVAITFDSATDRGVKSKGSGTISAHSSFVCSAMFASTAQSTGSSVDLSSTLCAWSSDGRMVSMSMNSYSVLIPGDSITLLANTVKAACPSSISASVCASWNYSSTSSATVSSPSSPLLPVVKISVPASIGSCDSLLLDVSESSGYGGRKWKSSSVSVLSTSTNTTALVQFIGSSNFTLVPPTSIPSKVLFKGYSYTFTVTLCNFLGGCAQGSSTTVVLNQVIPFVSVAGTQTQYVLRSDALTFSSSAFTANCDGSLTTSYLSYSWSLIASSSGQSLTSTSRDPSKFALSSYTVSVLTTYTVTLSVMNTQSRRSSQATVTLVVGQGSLAAVIAGGSTKSVRMGMNFTVDASQSVDKDYLITEAASQSSLLFTWSCTRSSPTYDATCPLSLFPTSTTSTIARGVALSAALDTTSVVMVMVYDSSGRQSFASVSLSVLEPSAPLVTIVSSSAGSSQQISKSANLLISATASMQATGSCSWSVDNPVLDITTISLMNPTGLLAQLNSVSKLHTLSTTLVVAGSYLPVSSTLTFSLMCSVTGSSVSASVAGLTVVVNSPPSPGIFAMAPVSGIELSTSFKFTASLWTDSDTPLSYAFYFYAPGTTVPMMVQSRSRTTTATSLLPGGLDSTGHVLLCAASIFDAVGANTTTTVSVIVTKQELNTSALQQAVTSRLSQVDGSIDGTKQVLSTLSAVVNRVNCSAAPNCTKLFREACSTTADTCGSCISSGSTVYVGEYGDSNNPCMSLSSLIQSSARRRRMTVSVCSSDRDCEGWETCDISTGSCEVLSKQCSSPTCSDHGECVFVQSATNTLVSECSVLSNACSAQCVCSEGYGGGSCELTDSELAAKAAIRSSLIAGLAYVNSNENIDSLSLYTWAVTLSSIAKEASQLSADDVTTAYALAVSILDNTEYASAATVSLVLNAMQVLAAVDASEPISNRRRLSDDDGSGVDRSQFLSALFSASDALVKNMVPLQTAQSVVTNGFRLSSQAIQVTSSDSSSVGLPLSAIESALVDTGSNNPLLSSSISISSTGGSSDDGDDDYNGDGSSATTLSVGVASLPYAYNLGASGSRRKLTSSSETISSNSLLLRIGGIPVCAGVDDVDVSAIGESTLVFKLFHNSAQTYGTVTSSSQQFVAQCSIGSAVNYTYYCNSTGTNMTIYCNGTVSGSLSKRCPVQVATSMCQVDNLESDVTQSCSVLNYTATYTTCSCSLCSTASGRRLSSSSMQMASLEMTSVTLYAMEEFASVSASASNFNSLSAVKAAALIIGTFAVLWIGSAVAVASASVIHMYKAAAKQESSSKFSSTLSTNKQMLLVGRRGGSSRKIQPLTDDSALNIILLQYLSSFFPPIFKEDSPMQRITNILWRRHRYLRVLFQDTGLKRWINWLEAMTELTVSMYLLAVFYSIQWPSNDGSCASHTDERDCLKKKSIFDSSQPMCQWDASTDICSWKQPAFHPFALIVITVLVVLISAPLNIMISAIFKHVLLAPTKDEMRARLDLIRERRRSAVLLVQQRAALQQSANGVNERKKTLFIRTKILDVQLETSCIAAQKSTKGYLEAAAANPKAVNNDALESICTELATFEKTSAASLDDPSKQRFQAQWGDLLKTGYTDDPADEKMSRLYCELQNTNEEAERMIEKLKNMTPVMRGVQILELFVADIMGRDSHEARIFLQQMEANLHNTMVITWGVKCMTISIVIIVNLYFVFTCMLYGRVNGHDWQVGWILSCMVNFLMDAFIKQVNLAFFIYFLVPNMIYTHTNSIRNTMTGLINTVCDKVSRRQKSRQLYTPQQPQQRYRCDSENTEFSATDYLFVSTKVAKAYPEQLESAIVMAYRTPFVSTHQAKALTGTGDSQYTAGFIREGFVSGLATALSLLITNLLLAIGAQSFLFQRVFVMALNPLLIGFIGFVGVSIVPESSGFIGIPIVLVIVMLIVGGLLYYFYIRNPHHEGEHSHRVGIITPVSAGDLNEDSKVDDSSPTKACANAVCGGNVDENEKQSESDNESASSVDDNHRYDAIFAKEEEVDDGYDNAFGRMRLQSQVVTEMGHEEYHEVFGRAVANDNLDMAEFESVGEGDFDEEEASKEDKEEDAMVDKVGGSQDGDKVSDTDKAEDVYAEYEDERDRDDDEGHSNDSIDFDSESVSDEDHQITVGAVEDESDD